MNSKSEMNNEQREGVFYTSQGSDLSLDFTTSDWEYPQCSWYS